MKKFVLLSLLSLFISSNLLAYAEVKPPEWNEFCPLQYVNAKYDYNNYTRKFHWCRDIILAFTIIGYPASYKDSHNYRLSLDAIHNQKINNYWVDRRIAFDKEIATCKADSNNQSLCYLKVREIEQNKQYQQEQREMAQQQLIMQSLNGARGSIQMQQINNNLDSINNSINRLKH